MFCVMDSGMLELTLIYFILNPTITATRTYLRSFLLIYSQLLMNWNIRTVKVEELKDSFSQGVENAMKQYQNDRDPREKLFQRCLVHFAMSDQKIYMATKLKGPQTRFLPFNKGLENPEVLNDYKTCYLYNDILQVNKLSNLLSNFIYIEKDEKTKKETPIFPRYHQLDCVNLLLGDCSPGKNYLIEHSAGSGKSKTIAWLAHGLIKKFDPCDERVYDMVIVVNNSRNRLKP